MKIFLVICFVFCFSVSSFAQLPVNTLVQISRAEDELRFDKTLADLLKNTDAKIRARATLAAGRIGNEAAIAALVSLLETDKDAEVRATAVFALGEIESVKAADAVLRVLADTKKDEKLRALAIEAAGKIAAANAKDAKAKELGEAILDALDFEDKRRSMPNMEAILKGLTAVLRVRPEEGAFIAAKFLTYGNPRIRIDAANTLARLRAKNANSALRAILMTDDDAAARANAARALGAAEDKDSLDILLEAALTDDDLRVRVSAIRAVGSLKDAKSAEKLIERGETLYKFLSGSNKPNSNPSVKNELLEIATILGRLLADTNNEKALNFLRKIREFDEYHSPETEIAFAKIAPEKYLKEFNLKNNGFSDWRAASSYAQGLGDLATQTDEEIKRQASRKTAGYFMDFLEKVAPAKREEMNKAVPDLLRAIAAFKHETLAPLLLEIIKTKDIFSRAAAAELIGELAKSSENIKALQTAFSVALVTDKKYNDAQLAILDALFKLDKKEAVGTLLTALNAPDYLVRKKAFDLLSDQDLEKDFPGIPTSLKNAKAKNADRVLPYAPVFGTKLGQILNTNADYLRAVSRKNETVKAVFTTEKGAFTIDLMPEAAPLTVDNFIKLAKSNYFNGLQVHRVVPNFVMQDGDPRGDGNGGPGWQIRCEINMLEFTRGAVGMALSGKDTGGSQWFVTHSPQPHLDGGYTVFGKVNENDMKIVDNIVRGDKILNVKIVENTTLMPTQKIKQKSKAK